jgi:hypothetical protein
MREVTVISRFQGRDFESVAIDIEIDLLLKAGHSFGLGKEDVSTRPVMEFLENYRSK